MKKEMICIVCPMGCHLTIDTETLDVKGNTCPRGAEYAKEELVAPKRVITSTVRIEGGLHRRMPVKTGDIVIKNVLGTGVDVVACRDM